MHAEHLISSKCYSIRFSFASTHTHTHPSNNVGALRHRSNHMNYEQHWSMKNTTTILYPKRVATIQSKSVVVSRSDEATAATAAAEWKAMKEIMISSKQITNLSKTEISCFAFSCINTYFAETISCLALHLVYYAYGQLYAAADDCRLVQ